MTSGRSRPGPGPSLLAALVLAAATGIVFAPSLDVPFFFDDVESITDNAHIRELWPPSVMLQWPAESTVAGRPVVAASLAVNYALGGLDVRGYHVFNMLVHAAAAMLLFGVIRRTLVSERVGIGAREAGRLALLIALMWTVHPLQTEAVAYTIQRTELLMGMFMLGTLYLALRGFHAARPGLWYAGSVACCLAGMGSKEVMVAAPVIVLLYDGVFVSSSLGAALRRRRGLYAGLAATWIALAALVAGDVRGGSVGFEHGMSAWHSLLTQARAIPLYLRLVFWPDPLAVYYHWPVVRLLGDAWLHGAFVLVLLALSVRGLIRRHPAGFLGVACFLILAPTTSVLPIVTELVAERRMYLPLAAILCLVVLGLRNLFSRPEQGRQRRFGLAAAAAVMIVAEVGTSAARLKDYRDPVTLWSANVASQPLDFLSHNCLGLALQAEGRHAEAVASYLTSIELRPDYLPLRVNLGWCLTEMGLFDQATVALEDALSRDPEHDGAHHQLGITSAQAGRYDVAAEHFEVALAQRADDPTAHWNLAGALFQSDQRLDDAAHHLREVLRLDPTRSDARAALARLQAP